VGQRIHTKGRFVIDPIEQFRDERVARMRAYATDGAFLADSRAWLEASMRRKYVYNFDWLGRPIIQYPQDMVALQEIVWSTRPDVIIETGIAHGGSLVLSASLLALLDLCDAKVAGELMDPAAPRRVVVGVDIDIRAHNREAIQAHPLADRIRMVQGSSIDPTVVSQVKQLAGDAARVMVCLDSMHTHDHVLAELRAYAPMVTPGCYCVVFDTFVEDMPKDVFADRPWGPGNSPKSAIREFLGAAAGFEADRSIQARLQITVAPDGYLRRVG
jgi:cephalosporin hydroxylase